MVKPSRLSAVVLGTGAGDRVRFVADADFHGVVSLSFRAWDQTDGSSSGDAGVDVTTNGSTSAYSATFDSAAINVLSVVDVVADAPSTAEDTGVS